MSMTKERLQILLNNSLGIILDEILHDMPFNSRMDYIMKNIGISQKELLELSRVDTTSTTSDLLEDFDVSLLISKGL